VTVKPEFVDYLRTMIRGDHTANDRVEAVLDEQGWDGFPRFMSALFFLAVDRRFGSVAQTPEIIKFVADLRVDVAEGGPEIDAKAAETLIRAAIQSSVNSNIPHFMIGTIQAATVYKILTEENLSDERLDAFFAEGVRLVSREE
jgi:hypothetical protein